jgi:WD40 repeat protein
MLNAIQSNYLPPLEINRAALNPPPLSLALHHAFGYEFALRRNTVAYCGELQCFEGFCYARKGFKRRIVMLADRVVVQCRAANLMAGEIRPKNTEQKHYEAHMHKISSLAVHPDKSIIATGEASNKSWIYLWNYQTLQTINKIRTLHFGGIVNMVFSYDGKYLASVGMNNVFSIQITDWKLERIIAFRSITNKYVLDIRFDPCNHLNLVICGDNFIEYLKIKGSNLESFLSLHLDNLNRPVATCLDYIFFMHKRKLKTELLIGSSQGDILSSSLESGVVSLGVGKAHSAPITHIKISCCLSTVIRILTAGEDSLIKIWDSRLKLIRYIDLRIEVMTKVNEFLDDTPIHMNPNLDPSKIAILMPKKQGSIKTAKSYDLMPHEIVQSLDFWHKIDTQKDEAHGRLPYILISTKSGFVIELLLEEPPKEKKIQEEPPDVVKHHASLIEPMLPKSEEDEKSKEYLLAALIFRSQWSTLSTNNDQILKKQLAAVHPFRPLIAIIGSNEELIIWDYDKMTILVKLLFDTHNPSTALKWHPKEDFFIVGFNSGMIHIYEIQDSLSVDLKKELKVCLDGFLPPVADSPILNIEFNSNGDLLAVSYGNSKVAKDDSFVQVYINRNMTTVDDINLTSEGKYLHYFDIRCPSVQATYEGNLRSYGMGVHFMNFTSDSRFILVCFQLINSNLQRNNKHNQGIYLLWDIKLNNAVKSWEGQKESHFRQLQFANHTKGQYRFFKPQLSNFKKKNNHVESTEQSMLFETVTFSSICQLTVKDEPVKSNMPLFLGDEAGFIHMTTVSSLYSPEGHEDSNKECLASIVRAHATGVDWIGLSGDGRWLFTRGVGDNSVLMWRIDSFGYELELDYLNAAHLDVDTFGEIPAPSKLEYCISNILSKRITAGEYASATSSESEGEIFFKLKQVIGRTAMNKRNNICYSSDNQLIIASGSLLILMDIPIESHIPDRKTSELYFKQSFLKPAEYWRASPAPEIGAIQICNSHKLLCISTYEKTTRLLFWHIESKSYTGTLRLPGFQFISLLRFASDDRTLAVLAIAADYTASLLLIDVNRLAVDASAALSYSAPFKIKDLAFLPGVADRFVTVGLNHVRLWKVAGGAMFGKNLDTGVRGGVRKEDEVGFGVKQEGEMENNEKALEVTFLCLIVVEKYYICGADDGSVFLSYFR